MPKTPPMPLLLCLACRNDNHTKCTTRVLDDDYQWGACPCACGGGLDAWLA